jgi:hypothetical protein
MMELSPGYYETQSSKIKSAKGSQKNFREKVMEF